MELTKDDFRRTIKNAQLSYELLQNEIERLYMRSYDRRVSRDCQPQIAKRCYKMLRERGIWTSLAPRGKAITISILLPPPPSASVSEPKQRESANSDEQKSAEEKLISVSVQTDTDRDFNPDSEPTFPPWFCMQHLATKEIRTQQQEMLKSIQRGIELSVPMQYQESFADTDTNRHALAWSAATLRAAGLHVSLYSRVGITKWYWLRYVFGKLYITVQAGVV